MESRELLNVTFDESPPPTKLSPLVDDDVGEEEAIKRNTKVVNNNNEEDESIRSCCLTSWMSKKQTTLAISTTKAEYVSAEKACQQALWMKQALVDYEVKLNDVPVLCDNKGAIDLSKNPVASEDNIAYILTKPLKREPFNLLRLGLGLMEPNA
ncbi:hypothetical protein Tco_0092924 [Tanacetum coccineum]